MSNQSALEELRPGTQLLRAQGGWARVARIRARRVSQPVYNLEVADHHSYFVGQSALWVHNRCDAGEGEATRGGPLTSAYRYVGPGEARIIEKTRLVPNTTRLGQPKNVSLTPQEFRSASQVEKALAVGRLDPRGPGVTPTHGVQVDLRGAPLSYGGTGATGIGGIEVQTPAAVRALRIFELEP